MEGKEVFYKHGEHEINLKGLNRKGNDAREHLLIQPDGKFQKHPYIWINTIRSMLDAFFPGWYDQSEGIVKKNVFQVQKPEWVNWKKTGKMIDETVHHVSKRVSLFVPGREFPIVFEIDASVPQSKLLSDDSLYGLSANLAARGLKQCCKTLGWAFRMARENDESITDFFNEDVEVKVEPTPGKKAVAPEKKETTPVAKAVEEVADKSSWIADKIREALKDFDLTASQEVKKAKANEIAIKHNVNKTNPEFQELFSLIKELLSL